MALKENKNFIINSISLKDLPLCCPKRNVSVFNMHPRVYLSFNSDKKVTCPYCNSVYHLEK